MSKKQKDIEMQVLSTLYFFHNRGKGVTAANLIKSVGARNLALLGRRGERIDILQDLLDKGWIGLRGNTYYLTSFGLRTYETQAGISRGGWDKKAFYRNRFREGLLDYRVGSSIKSPDFWKSVFDSFLIQMPSGLKNNLRNIFSVVESLEDLPMISSSLKNMKRKIDQKIISSSSRFVVKSINFVLDTFSLSKLIALLSKGPGLAYHKSFLSRYSSEEEEAIRHYIGYSFLVGALGVLCKVAPDAGVGVLSVILGLGTALGVREAWHWWEGV